MIYTVESDRVESMSQLRAEEIVRRIDSIIANNGSINYKTHKKLVTTIQQYYNNVEVEAKTRKELYRSLMELRHYSKQLRIIETRSMKDLQLINTLCESRLFRTKQALGKASARNKGELFYSILISTIALAQDTKTNTWAQEYASSASAFGNFDHFRTSGNDLYILSYSLQNELMLLSKPQAQVLIRIFRSLGRGNIERGMLEATLLRMERMLNISNAQLRNSRRIIVNWGNSSPGERKTSLVQLHRIIRAKGRLAEILPYILVLTKGPAGRFGKTSPLKKAAAVAAAGLAGLALGYRMHDPNKRWKVIDDVNMSETPLNEDRPTHLFDLVQNLKAHPDIEKIINVNYLVDGISAFVRTTDGNAYEIEMRPAKYAKGHRAKLRMSEGWEWCNLDEEMERGEDCTWCKGNGFNWDPYATQEGGANRDCDACNGRGYDMENPLAKYKIYEISDVLETYEEYGSNYWIVRAPEYGDSGFFNDYDDARNHAKELFPFLKDDEY